MRPPLSNHQQTDQQHLKNENIDLTVTWRPECHVLFSIHLSPAATQAAHQKAIKAVTKEVNIPGFRKGHAPVDFIKKNFGKAIESEWVQEISNAAWQNAMDLTSIYPLKRDREIKCEVKSKSFEDGSDLEISFVAFPVIPDILPEDLTLTAPTIPDVTENDFENNLHHLQMQSATWLEVKDRPATEGDYAVVDIIELTDPVQEICQEKRISLDKNKIDSWLVDAIVGMNPGEKRTVKQEEECKSCQDGEEHHHHGPHEEIEVTLHRIETPEMPEMDDSWAKKLGAEDIADLHKKLRSSLQHRRDEAYKSELRNQTYNALISTYSFDIPKAMWESAYHARKDRLDAHYSQSAMSQEESKEQRRSASENLKETAKQEVRGHLMLEMIIRDKNIQATQDEIMQAALTHMMSKQNQMGEQDFKQVYSNTEQYLLKQKALDFLAERASLIEKS